MLSLSWPQTYCVAEDAWHQPRRQVRHCGCHNRDPPKGTSRAHSWEPNADGLLGSGNHTAFLKVRVSLSNPVEPETCYINKSGWLRLRSAHLCLPSTGTKGMLCRTWQKVALICPRMHFGILSVVAWIKAFPAGVEGRP